MSRVKGILLGRCPRCGKGSLFQPGWRALLFMRDRCEVCGLNLMREAGYYTGAMYVSYFMGTFLVLPVATYLGVIARWPLWLVMLIMVVQTIVSMLIILRLSRTFWIHIDQTIDPDRESGSRTPSG